MKNRLYLGLMAVCFVLVLVSCDNQEEPAVEFPTPKQTHDGWGVANINTTRIDTRQVEKTNQAIANDPRFEKVQALLIAQDGKLVYEAYYEAPDVPVYEPGSLHTIQSVTKSYTSTLIGIAIDQGLIAGVDQTAQTLLPNLQGIDWSGGKDQITLEDILTMSAGFTGTDDTDTRLVDDFAYNMFSKSLAHAPHSYFDYRTALTNVLSDILAEALDDQDMDSYMEKNLFEPMDIQTHDWRYTNAHGRLYLGGGLYLTPRDMIKLGQLVLDKGRWQGRQIVSEQWIEAATAKHFQFAPRHWGLFDGYGYQWWHRDFKAKGKVYPAIVAAGYGGQFIIVLPSLNMVVGTVAWYAASDEFSRPLELIDAYLVDALR